MEQTIALAIQNIKTFQDKKEASLQSLKTIINDENQTVKTVRLAKEKYNALRFSVDYSLLLAQINAHNHHIVENNDESCTDVISCFLYGGSTRINNFGLSEELDSFVRYQWVDCNIMTLYGIQENPNDYQSFVSDIYDPEGGVEFDVIYDMWGTKKYKIDICNNGHKKFLSQFPVDSIDDWINQEWMGIDWEMIDRKDGSVFSASGADVTVLVAYFGIKENS